MKNSKLFRFVFLVPIFFSAGCVTFEHRLKNENVCEKTCESFNLDFSAVATVKDEPYSCICTKRDKKLKDEVKAAAASAVLNMSAIQRTNAANANLQAANAANAAHAAHMSVAH